MPDFAYEALTPAGTVERGRMTAPSEAELEDKLREQGNFLIRAEQSTAEADDAEAADRPPRRGRTDGSIPRRELLAFTEYLWGATQAGIPILTTLEDLEAQVSSRRLRQITAEVRESMSEEGLSLSESLAEHPRAFPALYVGTIEAGEVTGQLDYTLGQLVDYLEWQREITLQLRQATLYPLVVVLVMAALIVILLTFVYPRLMPVFNNFDVDLPLPTRIIMGLGGFATAYWTWMLVTVFGSVLLYQIVVRTKRGRVAVDTLKLHLPVFGPLLREIEMARVATYMALFYRTGIDLLRGLGILEQMLPNRRVAQGIRQAREDISGGSSITQAFTRTGLFPTVVLRSLALGETTGKLDETLDRARNYYNREVPASVRRMLAALQPMLIVFIGIVIGTIALSIFLPIVGIYQSIGT